MNKSSFSRILFPIFAFFPDKAVHFPCFENPVDQYGGMGYNMEESF